MPDTIWAMLFIVEVLPAPLACGIIGPWARNLDVTVRPGVVSGLSLGLQDAPKAPVEPLGLCSDLAHTRHPPRRGVVVSGRVVLRNPCILAQLRRSMRRCHDDRLVQPWGGGGPDEPTSSGGRGSNVVLDAESLDWIQRDDVYPPGHMSQFDFSILPLPHRPPVQHRMDGTMTVQHDHFQFQLLCFAQCRSDRRHDQSRPTTKNLRCRGRRRKRLTVQLRQHSVRPLDHTPVNVAFPIDHRSQSARGGHDTEQRLEGLLDALGHLFTNGKHIPFDHCFSFGRVRLRLWTGQA